RHPGGMAEQALEPLFHHLLHRKRVPLPLPSGIGGAAVGEGEAVDQALLSRSAWQSSSTKNGPQIAQNTQGTRGISVCRGRYDSRINPERASHAKLRRRAAKGSTQSRYQ